MKAFAMALGVTLIASLAMASMAFASPPNNKTKPVISPATPQLGVTAETSKGGWGGLPTSYEFAWKRCNSKGEECGSISGATAQTYTTTEADLGKTLVSAVTASNAEGSTTALSNPSGVVYVASPHWYVGGSKVAAGLSVEQASKNMTGSNFVWHFEWLGAPIDITCTSQSSAGTVENPLGGGAGLGETSSFVVSGCTTGILGENCTINSEWAKPGTIELVHLREEALELGGKLAIKFSPQFEEIVTTWQFGSKCGSLSGVNVVIKGTFNAVQESDAKGINRTLSYSSSTLKLGAKYVTLTGKSTLTSGGSALTLGA